MALVGRCDGGTGDWWWLIEVNGCIAPYCAAATDVRASRQANRQPSDGWRPEFTPRDIHRVN